MLSASAIPGPSALDRARKKAYWRLLPLLFLAYVIAFVDRANVSYANLTMQKDLTGFDNAVYGFGAGVFFLGYFLLEIPGSLIVERWSARIWIFRIMVTWGFVASLTAFIGIPLGVSEWFVNVYNSVAHVQFGRPALGVTEFQFYAVRFLLGLAEAGFFPGVVVFLTHWFPSRDRGRALAIFFMATPMAQIVAPNISFALLKIGSQQTVNGVVTNHPEVWGLEGWQWMFIVWGLPAVIIGFLILFLLPDHPKHARWLSADERGALEQELEREKALGKARGHMSLKQGLSHPKVALLSLAYFCTVTASYGIVFFMPTILDNWYKVKLNSLAWLVMLPSIVAVVGQLVVGWSSDRTKERRMHTVVPIVIGSLALALIPATRGSLPLTITCFMIAMAGVKAYLPAFWTMPNLFLSHAAAAASIGMINSVGNLGGQLGPTVIGRVEKATGSFVGGLYFLAGSMVVAATIVFFLGLGRKEGAPVGTTPPIEPAAPPIAPVKA